MTKLTHVTLKKLLVLFCGKFSQLGDKNNYEKVIGFKKN
jgi:hypothetical protein